MLLTADGAARLVKCRLSSLERLELEVPCPAALAALEVLALCTHLRHLHVRPITGTHVAFPSLAVVAF